MKSAKNGNLKLTRKLLPNNAFIFNWREVMIKQIVLHGGLFSGLRPLLQVEDIALELIVTMRAFSEIVVRN